MLLKMLYKSILSVIFIAGSISAKKVHDWYQGLQDPPGATVAQYAENKLLPKDFLIKMGLRDYPGFKIGSDKIQENGKEQAWNTRILLSAQKKFLVLPSVVKTNFFMPLEKPNWVWGGGYQKESFFNYRSKAYKDPMKSVRGKKSLIDMGFVARITMSHKKPDKILRFYEKLKKLDPPIAPIWGKNVCSNKDQSKSENWQKKIPYGLWRLGQARLQNRIFLVEGESTALTLWYHGYPALAFGGASKWHDNYMKYLEGIKDIYVLMEADTGGKVLLNCLRKISVEDEAAYQDFSKRVKLVILGAYGDASDLHTEIFKNPEDPKDFSGLDDPNKESQFKSIFESYVSEATPLAHPGYKISDEREIIVNPNSSLAIRRSALSYKKYTEDVGSNILSNRPKVSASGKIENPSDLYTKEEIMPSATLQDYSRKKNIPVSELIRAGFSDGIFPHRNYGPIFGVKMTTYSLPAGAVSPEDKVVEYYRYRTSMDSNQPSSDRFPNILFNQDGSIRDSQKKIIYGLENLANFEAVGSLYFVEGESDTIAMRHYGYAAVAIPGTEDWNEDLARQLANVAKIIVTIENDTGGEHGLKNLVHSSLADKLLLIDFSTGGKDPSDLHNELTKDIKVDLESFYQDDRYKSERQAIQAEFSDRLEKILLNGVYWRNMKKLFANYQAKRRDFDQEQERIYEVMKEKLVGSNCRKNTPTICQRQQDVDAKYMPWPYMDFYNTITGKTVKTYYDEHGKARPLPR